MKNKWAQGVSSVTVKISIYVYNLTTKCQYFPFICTQTNANAHLKCVHNLKWHFLHQLQKKIEVAPIFF